MSLRALKKRDFMNPYKKHPIPMRTRKLIEVKPNNSNYNNLNHKTNNNNNSNSNNDIFTEGTIRKRSRSLPNLTILNCKNNDKDDDDNNDNHNIDNNNINYNYSSSTFDKDIKLISKSDTDISTLIKNFTNDDGDLINAKSEICIKTISVHKTAAGSETNNSNSTSTLNIFQQGERNQSHSRQNNNCHHHHNHHHHHNSSCSLNGPNNDIINNNNNNNTSFISRRVSGQNLSMYSNRSITTNSSNDYGNNCLVYGMGEHHGDGNGNYNNRRLRDGCGDSGGFIDTSCILHIPIIGYEVMEERARFTVYKLRVENPFTNDCWLVLRRYTDFVRLNNKLKQAFPSINLQLPRKKLFGDNFNTVFLDNRVQGLQMFVNSIMSKDELRNSKIVRDFFCLDEPPMYSESMEECRAIFEAQEETIAHLKMQINSKSDTILSLQQRLSNEISEKEKIKMTLKHIASKCSNCSLLLSNLSISLHSEDDNKKCDH